MVEIACILAPCPAPPQANPAQPYTEARQGPLSSYHWTHCRTAALRETQGQRRAQSSSGPAAASSCPCARPGSLAAAGLVSHSCPAGHRQALCHQHPRVANQLVTPPRRQSRLSLSHRARTYLDRLAACSRSKIDQIRSKRRQFDGQMNLKTHSADVLSDSVEPDLRIVCLPISATPTGACPDNP